jgi:4'-phosphopantetheinyl transferase
VAQLQLWLIDAGGCDEAALAALAGPLGEDERRRCAAFVRPLRRRQFIVGRALARAALGDLLGIAAGTVRLQERAGAAPVLLHPSGAAHFSISHSGPWVACAVSRAPLGLDIELADPGRDLVALARQAFGADHAGLLAALPQAERTPRFYAWWCAAEAAFKLGQPVFDCAAIELPGLAIALACACALDRRPVARVVSVAELGCP